MALFETLGFVIVLGVALALWFMFTDKLSHRYMKVTYDLDIKD